MQFFLIFLRGKKERKECNKVRKAYPVPGSKREVRSSWVETRSENIRKFSRKEKKFLRDLFFFFWKKGSELQDLNKLLSSLCTICSSSLSPNPPLPPSQHTRVSDSMIARFSGLFSRRTPKTISGCARRAAVAIIFRETPDPEVDIPLRYAFFSPWCSFFLSWISFSNPFYFLLPPGPLHSSRAERY